MHDSEGLSLWYGDVLVGRIREVFQNDGIWFGILELAISVDDGDLPRRLLEYVREQDQR